MFERYLPSLDLKRQQLIADLQRSKAKLRETEQEIHQLRDSQEGLFSLLGASEQDLSGLVTLRNLSVAEENVLGVRLPVLEEVSFERMQYSMLAKPFWVDFLAESLEELAKVHVRRSIEQSRMEKLAAAVRRITQRVNLFEKVLIPRAKQDIQRIKIHLSDAERAAVVRSKIAKAKQSRGVATTEAA